MTKTSRKTPGLPPRARPLLIILSGPSGAGKDSILSRLKESGSPLEYITTVTTRPRRPGERNAIHYHFVAADRFQGMVERGELLEWAKVYEHWYGVPRLPVKQALEAGRDVIVKVDTQGAATLKKIAPQAVFIFVMPPSMEELVTRLERRRTESLGGLALRVGTAAKEIQQLSLFDYMVVNQQDEIDRAVAQIEAIITAEKCRVAPREIAL
ncbi:MAG: guanylate kinase [Chloroflexi bacterium]|nr:guanylate kinase [Chloroflexota bacterium]